MTFFIEFVGELDTERGQRVLSDRIIGILNFQLFILSDLMAILKESNFFRTFIAVIYQFSNDHPCISASLCFLQRFNPQDFSQPFYETFKGFLENTVVTSA